MIKSVSLDKKPKETYPRLMIHKDAGFIVYMFKPRDGVVIVTNNQYKDGYCSKTWGMDGFETYHGTVVFSNELEKSN
jgi:hypothetical protein